MALSPGSRLGPYQVTAQIGAGGMGEVYRARDTKLNRDVAIKVLLPAVANDPNRLARFSREAQLLASLNHSNIAQVHGLEESEGVRALVMELVEGPTLADRIGQGAIPLEEVLPIATQIADALEAAHEQGIIHRDLKPANIKVRPDGTVKVLDFGLAKAVDPGGASSDHAMNSPTLSIHGTQAGVILGTAAYMSPEQARGNVVDKRADLWAFGVVLYEMLTGTRLFDGGTTSDVLAAVLKVEPDWQRLPADTPAPIRKLLRRCLEKDRKRRVRDAGDARFEIEDASGWAPDTSSAVTTSPPFGGTRLAWVVAAVALTAAVALAVPVVQHLRELPPTAPPETRVDIHTPTIGTLSDSDPLSLALSPDGLKIVFVASGDGPTRLWLRSLDDTVARPLTGTDGAVFPFWSPDSRSVAFFADDQLKLLDLGGGAPRTLTAGIEGRGGTWNADGVILFAPGRNTPLSRIPVTGGNPVPVTTLDGQISHRFPFFLPDGRHFLFYGIGRPDTAGIHVASIDGGTPIRLVATADSAGVFRPNPQGSEREGGWLLWVRAGALVTQQLNLKGLTLTGETNTLADAVEVNGEGGFNFAALSVSATGLVAYRSRMATWRHQLTWVDRTGKVLGALGPADDASLAGLRLAPDGRRALVLRTVQGNQDIWLLDGPRTSRLTFDPNHDRAPVFSPDGRHVVFDSDRAGGVRHLYLKAADGAEPETLLVESIGTKQASDWSRDGRFLLYNDAGAQAADLWVQPMDPTSGAKLNGVQPWAFLRTSFDERWGKFSPDGRWVAYQSNESGRPEIYIRPFSPLPPSQVPVTNPGEGRRQVSTAGGTYATWRADGRELFFVGPNGNLMAAALSTNGATLEPGTPVSLFPLGMIRGTPSMDGRNYDVTRDGRFLINRVLDNPPTTPITLIQNWQPK